MLSRCCTLTCALQDTFRVPPRDCRLRAGLVRRRFRAHDSGGGASECCQPGLWVLPVTPADHWLAAGVGLLSSFRAGVWFTYSAGSPQVDFQPALHKLVGVHACNPSPCQDHTFKVVLENLRSSGSLGDRHCISRVIKNAFKE